MADEERNKELEKRGRLVQTFLTIGGFFVAFTENKFQQLAIAIFAFYLFFIMLYYIFISRGRGFSTLIDSFAILSSIPYSFLIMVLFYSHAPNSWSADEFWFVLIGLICILTFSLLSPERSNRIIEFFTKLCKNNTRATNIVGLALSVILTVWFIFYVLSRVKFA